jgi:hypothetical protein
MGIFSCTSSSVNERLNFEMLSEDCEKLFFSNFADVRLTGGGFDPGSIRRTDKCHVYQVHEVRRRFVIFNRDRLR